MIDFAALDVRCFIVEPDRGRRHWTTAADAQRVVYNNRRRVRGARGRQLMRRRGETIERSFAHLYDSGGLRRTHLRGHQNILKRLLVHASAFNLGVLMRKTFGRGTPRRLQGRRSRVGAPGIACGTFIERTCSSSSGVGRRSSRTPSASAPCSS